MFTHSLTALLGAAKRPDFGPTGFLRDVYVGSEEECYKDTKKPDCEKLNCPRPAEFNLPNCNIINCWDATAKAYGKAAFQFNTAQPLMPSPCVVVMADSVSCIQDVVKEVQRLRKTKKHQDIRLAIRGGRHSYIGASTMHAGVVVDVSQFKTLTVDPVNEEVIVGAGNTLGELYDVLANQSLQYPGGTCPGVGISGLTLGGGKGILLRKHGLSADQVIEIQMVNAHGEIMTINEHQHNDLFWALRGGGSGNFGIVYEFKLKAYRIPDENHDLLYYFHDSSDWHIMIEEWQNCLQTDDFQRQNKTWSRLTITPTELIIGFHISGSISDIPTCIHSLAAVPTTTVRGYTENLPFLDCKYTPETYTGSLAFWAACTPENRCGTPSDFRTCLKKQNVTCGRPFTMQSGYQNSEPNPFYFAGSRDSTYLSPAGIKLAIHYMLIVKNRTGCEVASMQMDSLGGKLNGYKPTDTAFPHRDSTLAYQFLSYYDMHCDKTEMVNWFTEFFSKISPYLGSGKYRNYANLETLDHNVQYFQENIARLEKIKFKHDPNNFFKYSQSIQPSDPNQSRWLIILYIYLFGVILALVLALICILIGRLSTQKADHSHSD